MVGLRRANRPRSRRRLARAALPSLVSFRQLASQHLSAPEGSLDEASLDALVHVLASHSADGADTLCFAFYAPEATGDYDHPTLLSGPLRAVRDLVEAESPLWAPPVDAE